jgi:hypothetical protein
MFNLYLYPVNVQGDGTAASIIHALLSIERNCQNKKIPNIDVIVMRGAVYLKTCSSMKNACQGNICVEYPLWALLDMRLT